MSRSRPALLLALLALATSLAVVPHAAATSAPLPAGPILDLNARPAPLMPLGGAGVRLGSRLLFTSMTRDAGVEIWQTDGTAAGTRRAFELAPGPDSRSPAFLTAVGETVFFCTDCVSSFAELWRTDGTPAGTRSLARMSDFNGILEMTAVGQRLFFTHGATEVWTSDGTAAGTVRLATIPRPDGVWHGRVRRLVAAGDRLFFIGADGRLWTSDGTAAGTAAVGSSVPGEGIRDAHDIVTWQGRAAVVTANDQSTQLWVSDGTAAGTRLIAQAPSPQWQSSAALTASGDRIFFTMATPEAGREIWTSDGTPQGTRLAGEIQPGAAGGFGHGDWVALIPDGAGRVYVSADDGVRGAEVWMSDGSGVTRVADLNPGADGSQPQIVRVAPDALLVTADAGDGRRLWRLSAGGAAPVLAEGGAPLGGAFLVGDLDGRAVLSVVDGERAGLWTLGASGPAQPLVRIASATEDASLTSLTSVGSRLAFVGPPSPDAPGWTSALWVSDGTAPGTRRVLDLGNAPTVVRWGRWVYALRPEDSGGMALWRTDGETTEVVLAPGAGAPAGMLWGLTVAGDQIFFLARQGETTTLWRTDGTVAGTREVAVPAPEDGLRGVTDLAAVGARLFFVVQSLAYREDLYVTDGTDAGTRGLTVFRDPEGSFSPRGMTAVGDRLFFVASTEAGGAEPWVSDGTVAGTRQIADIFVDGSAIFFDTPFAPLGSGVIFPARDRDHGEELWWTDGTPQGTRLVKDIHPGAGSAFGFRSTTIVPFRGHAYFAANDGASGRELWRTDGTAQGTVQVADLVPGPLDGAPRAFLSTPDALLFAASSPAHGDELWRTDGTAQGTRLAFDAVPGAGSSVPRDLTVVGGTLYFTGLSPATGRELWAAPLAEVTGAVGAPATPASGGALQSPDGVVRVIVPSGAVDRDVRVVYAAQDGPDQPLDRGRQALRAFTLTAWDAAGQPVRQFAQPLTITVQYTDAAVAALGLVETQLTVVYWDGARWVDLLPCDGCGVDTTANVVTARVDHFTPFALVGRGEVQVFLPLATR